MRRSSAAQPSPREDRGSSRCRTGTASGRPAGYTQACPRFNYHMAKHQPSKPTKHGRKIIHEKSQGSRAPSLPLKLKADHLDKKVLKKHTHTHDRNQKGFRSDDHSSAMALPGRSSTVGESTRGACRRALLFLVHTAARGWRLRRRLTIESKQILPPS